ncbi:MAG: hypothetical protein AAF514_01510 [Verrucomicrobiota bacterium]
MRRRIINTILFLLFLIGLVKLTDFQHPLTSASPVEQAPGMAGSQQEYPTQHQEAANSRLKSPGTKTTQSSQPHPGTRPNVLTGKKPIRNLNPTSAIDEGEGPSEILPRPNAGSGDLLVAGPQPFWTTVSGYLIEGTAPRLPKWKNLTPDERSEQLAALEEAGGTLFPLESIAAQPADEIWLEIGRPLDEEEPTSYEATSKHEDLNDYEQLERPGFQGTRVHLSLTPDDQGRFGTCLITPQQWPHPGSNGPAEIEVADQRSVILRLANPGGDSLVLLSFDFTSLEALARGLERP